MHNDVPAAEDVSSCVISAVSRGRGGLIEARQKPRGYGWPLPTTLRIRPCPFRISACCTRSRQRASLSEHTSSSNATTEAHPCGMAPVGYRARTITPACALPGHSPVNDACRYVSSPGGVAPVGRSGGVSSRDLHGFRLSPQPPAGKRPDMWRTVPRPKERSAVSLFLTFVIYERRVAIVLVSACLAAACCPCSNN
jgi:hypothetical protein